MTQTLNLLISPIIVIMILHNSWRSGANGVFYGVYSYRAYAILTTAATPAVVLWDVVGRDVATLPNTVRLA